MKTSNSLVMTKASLLLLALVFAFAVTSCGDDDNPPGDRTSLPSSYTTLTEGIWADGDIPSSGAREQWFGFTATASSQYIHVFFGGLDDIIVQVYNSSGDKVGESYLYATSNFSLSLTSGHAYYIKVTPFSPDDYGSYRIAFNTLSYAPSGGDGTLVPGTPTNVTATALSSNGIRITWDAPTSGGTPTIYYIYCSSSETDTYFNIGSTPSVFTEYTNFGLYPSTTYYYRVSALNNTGASAQSDYAYATTDPADSSFPPSNPTTLINGKWEIDSITDTVTERWYTFTVNEGYSYNMWWNEARSGFGDYTADVEVSVYYRNGVSIYTNINSAWYSTLSFTARFDGRVYIKVAPRSSSSTGSYAIVYSTNSTRPGGSGGNTWPPSTSATLTEGQWTNGNIPSSDGEEWFKFTATTSATNRQFIHVNSGELTRGYVQVYNISEETMGENAYFFSNNTSYSSRTLISGQTYYIKVTPFNDSYSGTYQIAFNTSSTAPGMSWPPFKYTTLNADQWIVGNINQAGGEQWFMFTATASEQHIHIKLETLDKLYVQINTSNGVLEGSHLYEEDRSFSWIYLTSGQTYYIRVWPYDPNGYGLYRIAFSASGNPPD